MTGRGQGYRERPRAQAGGQASAVATALARTNDDLTTWVQGHCTAVPAAAWRTSTAGAGSSSASGGLQLYDCAGASHT